jgi:CBS domain-containing protein
MSLKVSEVMNRRVVTVLAEAPVLEALRLMLEERISGIPVTDATGALAGMLTEGDFLRRSELGTAPHHPRWLEFILGPGRLATEYVDTHGRKVSEVMTPRVITIGEDAPLTEAVRLMEQHRIKRLPVLRNNRLVGILSRADLLRAVVAAAATSTGDTSDEGIRRRLADEIGRQPWSPQTMISVGVADGVVHLRGVLFDDRLRTALRVLVENVPGVKQIHDHLATIEPMSGFVVQAPTE